MARLIEVDVAREIKVDALWRECLGQELAAFIGDRSSGQRDETSDLREDDRDSKEDHEHSDHPRRIRRRRKVSIAHRRKSCHGEVGCVDSRPVRLELHEDPDGDNQVHGEYYCCPNRRLDCLTKTWHMGTRLVFL